MKLTKIIVSISLLFGLANAKDLTNKELNNLDVFKKNKIEVKGSKVITKNADIYFVTGIAPDGKEVQVAVDKTGRYVFPLNAVIDTVAGKNIKAPKIPKDVSAIKGKHLFKYGNGPKKYYVFTDPECPYCQDFEGNWKKVKDKATFYVYFFNLEFHKNADAMARWVLAAKTDNEKAKRLHDIGEGSTEYKNFKPSSKEEARLNKLINGTKDLGKKLGVSGTPAVFDEQGNSVAWPTIK